MMRKIYIFYGIKNKKRMGQAIIKTYQRLKNKGIKELDNIFGDNYE